MNKLILLLSFCLTGGLLIAQDIQLPAPDKSGGKSLMQALNERQSQRDFQQKELSPKVLSNLLWAANGFNRDDKRTAPTANNRQELELYVVLQSGIYFYEAKAHYLKQIRQGDYRRSAGTQPFVAEAPVNILFVSDLNKASNRELAYADCGFVSQNIYLYCASEGLATVVRASIDSAALAKELQLAPNQEVLLGQSVGYPR